MKFTKNLGKCGMAGLSALVLITAPVCAATLETEEIVYEIDAATDISGQDATERYIAQPYGEIAPSRRPIASFGPFHMLTSDRAELIGSIESETPAQFAALLRAFPGLRQIDMVECPGTGDDEANLTLARMIRRHGVMTYVPEGGSVRSGGVELFLAGAKRAAAPSAEFAVHSWRDEDGLEAGDYAANDPANLAYLNFYREMGMSEAEARAFYSLTNSVPHTDALFLNSNELARYVRLD
jgi:hypothetical protein